MLFCSLGRRSWSFVRLKETPVGLLESRSSWAVVLVRVRSGGKVGQQTYTQTLFELYVYERFETHDALVPLPDFLPHWLIVVVVFL